MAEGVNGHRALIKTKRLKGRRQAGIGNSRCGLLVCDHQRIGRSVRYVSLPPRDPDSVWKTQGSRGLYPNALGARTYPFAIVYSRQWIIDLQTT